MKRKALHTLRDRIIAYCEELRRVDEIRARRVLGRIDLKKVSRR